MAKIHMHTQPTTVKTCQWIDFFISVGNSFPSVMLECVLLTNSSVSFSLFLVLIVYFHVLAKSPLDLL